MITKKPTLKLIYLILTILFVLSFNAVVKASEVAPDAEDTEDLEGIEELLAVDEEVEKEAEGGSGVKSSEADVLTKAQRIVIELNNDNTKRVIDDFEYVLVLGYAPWCPRSAELMPQFAEAATSLKELGIPLQMAKLDADRYPKSASLLGIKRFPTMLLFVNGSSQVYSVGFTAPFKPEITVKSFKVQTLYVGEGSDFSGVPTKLMTVNGTLRMNIYNPATFFGIHVHSKAINIVFSDIIVASGQLKKHYQPRKSHRVLSVNLKGNKVPLYGAGSTIKHSQTAAVEVSLTLKLEILSVGNVVGKVVRAKTHKQITCPLLIDSSTTKPIKFNKSSCSYI